MTKEQVKKALEYCVNSDGAISCPECELYDFADCRDELIKSATQCISDQEKEIEQHKNDYDRAFERLKVQQREIDKLKADNQILTEALSYMAGLYGFRLSRTKLDDEIEYSYNGYVIDKENWLRLKKAEAKIVFWE